MKKILNKKYILLTIIILLVLIISFVCKKFFNKKKEIIPINIDNLIYNVYEKVYIKDIIDIETNDLIDTNIIGSFTKTISQENDDVIYNYNINYSVEDNIPPLIKGSSSYTIEKGNKIDLVNKMLCGDNYDKRPNCFIEGNYDVNKVGEYNLIYKAIDSSNNESSKNFSLIVKEKINSSSSKSKPQIDISDFINNYKTDNTMIGIDVSAWQDNINFKKVKDSGAEFVIIRMAYGYNKDNEIVYDKRFKQNIINAKNEGLKVGLYFYTYAKNIEESINQAKWIVKELNGESLDLPIAFDWENFENFNSYNISFHDLNNMYLEFAKELTKNGYKAMLYGSAYYLEHIWNVNDTTWLAHYTTKTDYSKEYYIWQLSNRGKISGINGNVDINILYKKDK